MSARTRQGRGRDTHREHGADPWWGDGDAELSSVGMARVAGERVRPPARRSRDGIGWILLGLALAPVGLAARLLRRSERLRRWAVRLLVVCVIGVILACSVGVILINNVVIGRTAELGRLDDERRELRRENALLDAQAARLQLPTVVRRRAMQELGMVDAPTAPKYVFLEPGSRLLDDRQRRVIATVAARRAAALQARRNRTATTSSGGAG